MEEKFGASLITKTLARSDFSIKQVMRVIDQNGLGTAFIVNKQGKFVGLVTDGDIRRALLKGVSLEDPISKIMNRNAIVVRTPFTKEKIHNLVKREEVRRKIPLKGTLKIPVLNDDDKVVDILFISHEIKTYSTLLQESSIVPTKTVRKILVIGGAGYIGSVLVRKLLQKEYVVYVLDNLTYGDHGIKDLTNNPDFIFIKGDVRNLSDVLDAIKHVDAVVHLAAIVGEPACSLKPEESIQVNYLATKMLAETCKYFQVNRFIFASTCSVYGESLSPDELLTEEATTNPISLYAEMKLKSEQALLEMLDDNFSPTILRFATVYGVSPRMRFDLVVNLLTAKAIFDKEITIFGGSQWRPFIHVGDVADAIIKCLEAPISQIRGQIFNVASQNIKIMELGKIIQKHIPSAKLIVRSEIKDRRSYKVSSNKINKTLGFKPSKKIEDGVLEIKEAIKQGVFTNYTDKKYNNYIYLRDYE